MCYRAYIIFSIISLWELLVSVETRVFIRHHMQPFTHHSDATFEFEQD